MSIKLRLKQFFCTYNKNRECKIEFSNTPEVFRSKYKWATDNETNYRIRICGRCGFLKEMNISSEPLLNGLVEK